MKLHTEKRDITRSGVLIESQFKIKATAKAFGILSSGLYSDKILAIVRELSCNAFDSHIAAGNRETPIEIKLPTTLDPTFYVKDYGVGLDHAGVTELYTTYFESTKSDSNDFIGALGLGSKSPFSYVPTFSVEARYNGTKRLYTAFINEDGVPSITLLGEEKTDEPNGLTVSLAAKRGDEEKFISAAKRSLMYFDVLPKVIGGGSNFKPYGLKHTVTGTNWKLREADYYANMSGAYVVQGLVAYPIDKEILRQHNLSDVGYLILGQNIDLFVKIGDVEVAASREALSYTKATIENLVKIVDTAAREMRDSIQAEFDKQKSMWDARMLHTTYSSYSHKMRHLYEKLTNAKPFTYKGKEVDDEIKLNLSKVSETQLAVQYVSRYGRANKQKIRGSGSWDPSNATKEFSFTQRAGMTIVVDDSYGGKPILSQYLADATKNARDDDAYVLIIKGLTKKTYSQKEVDAILQQLGATEVVYTSKLSYVVQKQKYAYRAKKSDEAMVWVGFPKNGGYHRDQLRRVFSRLCWNGTKIDLNKGGFYVPVERFTIMYKGDEKTTFDIFLEKMIAVGVFDKNTKVVGLTEKQCALIAKNKKWFDVFKYAEEKFAELNAKNELTNAVVGERVISNIGDGVRRHIVGNWSAIEPKLVNGAFKDVFTTIVEYKQAYDKVKIKTETISAAAEQIARSSPVGAAFNKKVKDDYESFVSKFDTTMSKYAMLKIVDWSKVGAKDVQMIIDYVNFIAKS